MSVGYLNVKDKKPSCQHDMHFFMELSQYAKNLSKFADFILSL